jgi:hypothetical protein
MSDFSIENVGAFELGAPVSALFDGALEAATLNPGAPTKPGWTGMCCGRIDDDALEAFMHLNAGPTRFRLTNGQCLD